MNAQLNSLRSATALSTGVCLALLSLNAACGQEDVADVPAEERSIKETPLMYYVIGGQATKVSVKGYKVLVVLPGGDGSADSLPFVKRIYKHALSEDYLVIQLVSHHWRPNQQIVWPTQNNKVPSMKLSTEEFLTKAVSDVADQIKLDQRHIYALGWSSGGPAVYAATLSEETPLTGAFVAMSVFRPKYLPPLDLAKHRTYYLWHSPDDRICPYHMAVDAEKQLREEGAAVKLTTYPGGHGWRGNVFGELRNGVTWLEEQDPPPPEKKSSSKDE